MDRVALHTLGATAAAALGAAAYLDGKYALRKDFRLLLDNKQFAKRMDARIKDLGSDVTLYNMLLKADPNASALWFEHRTWTYAQLRDEVDRFAEVLQARGVQSRDFVAVFMTNSPEMVITIYAIAKLGAVPALINASLRKETFVHCVKIATSQLIVSSADLTDHVVEILNSPDMSLQCISLNLGSFTNPARRITPEESIGKQVAEIATSDLARIAVNNATPRPQTYLKDIAALVYTSGTSGMPKAVACKNILLIVVSTPSQLDIRNQKKYILDLLSRTKILGLYFLSQSSGVKGYTDALRGVIVAHGNGMQGDVWEKFQARFGIDEVREIYRSTEGIAKFDNLASGSAGVGKVGFNGPFTWALENTTYLVKYDPETEEPFRDPKTGFCVVVKDGEPGEAIGRVRSMDAYHEYLNNPKANKEKVICDVFEKGDKFQRTGDLLLRNKDGWIQFVDRTGDTFRWQGENVAAGEVRSFIGRLPNVHDVVVYGVKLPGYDGQAGAAGVTLHDSNSSAEAHFARTLYETLRAQGLTAYQVPRLVRFIKKIEVNATFKHLKNTMKERSWDPERQVDGESVWYLDSNTYRKLDSDAWAGIQAGKARL